MEKWTFCLFIFFSSLRLFCCKHLKHFKAIQRRLAAMGCGGDWFVSEREETTQGWRLAPICDCWLKREAFSPVQRDLLSTKISGSGTPATKYQQTGSSDNFRGVKKNIHQNCLNFYVGLSIFFSFFVSTVLFSFLSCCQWSLMGRNGDCFFS